MNKDEQALLLLEDGTLFKGKAAGAKGKAFGRVVFNTGMVGYQQQLTDTANDGLLIVQTFPLIGNYGVNQHDNTTPKAHAAGYIVRELCDQPSNYRCTGTLPDFLSKNSVVTITGIDTRSITRHIREKGEMKGVIATGEVNIDELKKELSAWEYTSPKNPSSSSAIGTIGGEPPKFKLAVIDFGIGMDCLLNFVSMGAEPSVYSPDTDPQSVIDAKPDGIFISNGGGNPNDYKNSTAMIKALAKSGIPILGVGFGHIMLALSMGGSIDQMHCGHRGANQPVYRHENSRTYITNQNHGYVVSSDKLPENAKVSYKSSNDHTVEGLIYNDITACSVQFMPDTTTGVQSTRFIYEDFINTVIKKKGGVN